MKQQNHWKSIAETYSQERKEFSFPSKLLDKLIISLVDLRHPRKTLDFGAGIGTLAIPIAEAGFETIAYEPTKEMRNVFTKELTKNHPSSLILIANESEIPSANNGELALCLNVLDHIKDVLNTLKVLNRYLKNGGQLILSIPHPFKDIGRWVIEEQNGHLNFLYFRIDGYFEEGICYKDRENKEGYVVTKNVPSFHRILATYLNWIIESGFIINKVYEPEPEKTIRDTLPALYNQSKMIPYFFVIDCVKVNDL